MASVTSKPASGGLPSVNISPHCHLDPASYVKGTHQLTLEAGVLVHPRSKLFTELGSITIKEGSIVSERCTIGTSTPHDLTMQHQRQAPGQPELPITIGRSVYIHPNVKVQSPCTIADFVILEPGVAVSPHCVINSHAKICAGVALPAGTVIPSWTVVYGTDGRMRRRRHKDASEDSRLDGMARERSAAVQLLKMSTIASKTASSTSANTSRSKKESVHRN